MCVCIIYWCARKNICLAPTAIADVFYIFTTIKSMSLLLYTSILYYYTAMPLLSITLSEPESLRITSPPILSGLIHIILYLM